MLEHPTALTQEASSCFAALGDYTMHYHDTGDPRDGSSVRDPVVLLHGGGPGASGWLNFSRNVTALARSRRVLVVDQVGYGRSDKPIVDDVDTFNAQRVVDLLDHLGIDKAHLVGNSLGGTTALVVAIDHPSRVGRLVLMGSGGFVSSFAPQPTEGIKATSEFVTAPEPRRDALRRLFDIMLFDRSAMTEELFEQRFAAASDPSHRAFISGYLDARRRAAARGETTRGAGLWREVAGVRHETLVVWGRDDRVVPLDGALYLLRQLPNARLMVYSGCGHWVQMEKADQFNALVDGFLSEEET